jgi:hypothetical protein
MNVPPPKLLEQQLDILDQQADLERWKNDHELAMLTCDIDDFVALALETLERIRRRRAAPDSGMTVQFFKRWHHIAVKALAGVEFLESEGYQPERADEFRFAINEASIAADFDRVAAAQNRLRAGIGRSLEEVIHENKAG